MMPCIATVGTFDGPHIGHVSVFNRVNELAREKGCMSRVITFINHPLSVINPDLTPKWIINRDIEIGYIENIVDRVSLIHFTKELALMTAAEFMAMLRERYGVDTLVMGYDNAFGSDRLASHEEYIEEAAKVGVDLVFADPVVFPEETSLPVSSSRIRQTFERGDVREGNDMLGRPMRIVGTVIRGEQLGRKIGYPTLNLEKSGDTIDIADGVYMGYYLFEDKNGQMVPQISLLSVGSNPTVSNDGRKKYEMHVVNTKLPELYGSTAEFVMVGRLRGVVKFASIKELKNAIREDIKRALCMARYDERMQIINKLAET